MFRPFSGWLFNPDAVPDPGKATSPPYDNISDDDREVLLARSPYNIVRLLQPGLDSSSYERAGNLLRQWCDQSILVADDSPRFYLHEIDYTAVTGESRQARGVIGALELRMLGKEVVPHEETMDKHREDRRLILDATRANLDPIIALSAAPDLPGLMAAVTSSPRLEFTDAYGSIHRLSDIADADTVRAITVAVGAHPVSIADGHHRYTTALAFRNATAQNHGPGPWDTIMTLVAPAEGSGLTIGPFHRILPAFAFDRTLVDDAFDVTRIEPRPPTEPGSLVVVGSAGAFLLRPRPEAIQQLPIPWREASSAVAQELLYPRLGITEEAAWYSASASKAIAAALAGPEVAVLVAPVTEHAVAAAGEMGIKFPTKTTYFTPKPRAGLVVRCFRSDA